MKTLDKISGRLWDITKPLFGVCKLVAPDKYNDLLDAILSVADDRIEDKKQSNEGQIVQYLYELSPDDDNVPEWEIKLSDLLEKFNAKRQDKYKFTPQKLGKKLQAMGIGTKIIQGYSQIYLKKVDFDILLIQYGIREDYQEEDKEEPEDGYQEEKEKKSEGEYTFAETLRNSTDDTEQDVSRVSVGRESVESRGESPNSLPDEILISQGFQGTVDSCRESSEGVGGSGKIKISTFQKVNR